LSEKSTQPKSLSKKAVSQSAEPHRGLTGLLFQLENYHYPKNFAPFVPLRF